MKKKQENNITDYPVILKSGSSDLRRQEKTLIKLINSNYQEGIQNNNLYAFSNTANNAIKILKINNDNSIKILKLKRSEPFPWPEYKKKGEAGYTVELTGEKKKEFLKIIGCPENL